LASYLTWRYGHIFMFGRLAAMSAGLHIAAFFLEHETKIGTVATAVSVVIPVASTSASLVGAGRAAGTSPPRSSGYRAERIIQWHASTGAGSPPQPGSPHDAVVAL
jgi:hypothetical protein